MQEYESADDGLTPAERMAGQRAQLKLRMGGCWRLCAGMGRARGASRVQRAPQRRRHLAVLKATERLMPSTSFFLQRAGLQAAGLAGVVGAEALLPEDVDLELGPPPSSGGSTRGRSHSRGPGTPTPRSATPPMRGADDFGADSGGGGGGAPALTASLSARERNRLKRKSKGQLAKSDSLRSTDSRGASRVGRAAGPTTGGLGVWPLALQCSAGSVHRKQQPSHPPANPAPYAGPRAGWRRDWQGHQCVWHGRRPRGSCSRGHCSSGGGGSTG